MNNIIKEFNEISLDFLSQTSALVGYIYFYKFKLMTKVNCLFAIDLFIQKVLPYKQQIMSKDETFFINKSTDMTDYMNDIIGIKQIYHTLDNKSKENIWEILLALTYLAEERYIMNNKRNISLGA
jgi:hypothetical protein